MWHNWRHSRYRRRCRAQLPQACHIMLGSLQAGLTLEQALGVVAQEGPAPLREACARAMTQLACGMAWREVIANLEQRIGGEDMVTWGFLLRLLHQSGGNGVASFHALLAMLRDTARARQRIGTFTAQGRVGAVVIAGLPLVTVTLMARMVPAAVLPLFTTPLGWGCVGGALLLNGIGLWWIRRMTTIAL